MYFRFVSFLFVSVEVVWTVEEDVNQRASISPAAALTAELSYEPTFDARVCDGGVGFVGWSGYGSGLITC